MARIAFRQRRDVRISAEFMEDGADVRRIEGPVHQVGASVLDGVHFTAMEAMRH